jgi:hypothetical protein
VVKNYDNRRKKESISEKINKNIYNDFKDITINDNVIVYTMLKPDIIKSIVCSILLKESREIDFYSKEAMTLINESFTGEDFIKDVDYYESIEYFILIESRNTNHEYFKNIVGSIIYNRAMRNKKTLMILTPNKAETFINKELVDLFKVKNIKSGNMISSVRSNENRRIV